MATTALLAIGAVTSAIGAGEAASQKSEQAKAQAQAAQYNAQVAQNNAQVALQQSAVQEAEYRAKTTQDLATIKAGYGASGITQSGTPENVLASNASVAELNALNIRYAGQLKAQGFQQEGTLDTFQAANANKMASDAQTNGMFGMAGALLGGAAGIMTRVPSGTSPVLGTGMNDPFGLGPQLASLGV